MHVIRNINGTLTEIFPPNTIVDDKGIQHAWQIVDVWSDDELNNIEVYRVPDAIIPNGKQQVTGANPTYKMVDNTVIQIVETENIPVVSVPVQQPIQEIKSDKDVVLSQETKPTVDIPVILVKPKTIILDTKVHEMKIDKVILPEANISMTMVASPPSSTLPPMKRRGIDVHIDQNHNTTKQIVSHNEMLFFDVKNNKYVIPDCFKSKDYSNELYEAHAQTSVFSCDSIIYDRTNVVPCFLNMKNVSPLPSVLGKPTKSFTDICVDRAKELAAKNKLIRIMWSGGIDSTAIVAAFILAGVPKEQIVIHYNENSVNEYSDFFTKTVSLFQSEKGTGELTTNVITKKSGLYVHGQLGDQLYAYTKHLKLYNQSQLNDDFRKYANETVQAFVAPILKKLPRKVETLFDYCWFVNFILKWQTNKFRYVVGFPNRNVNLVSFYDADSFQNWSMFSGENLNPDPLLLKAPSKKVILDYNGDQEYFKQMIKVESGTLLPILDWMFLMEDFTYAA